MIYKISKKNEIESILENLFVENCGVRNLETSHFQWGLIRDLDSDKRFEIFTPIFEKKCEHQKQHTETRFKGIEYVQSEFGVLISKEMSKIYNLYQKPYKLPKTIYMHVEQQ